MEDNNKIKKENKTITVNGQQITGEIVRIEYQNGDIYEGQCDENNRPNGQGIYTYKCPPVHGFYTHQNGDRYEGTWVNGKKHGKGVEYYANGNIEYVGDFKNGKREGCGIFFDQKGNTYEGEWVNDEQEGYGTFTWNDGEKYVGEFKEGQWHGKGTLYYANGTIHYDGYWEEDRRGGYRKNYDKNGEIYVGEWDVNAPYGYGRCFYPNGDRYEGEWDFGLHNGYGIYTYQNGNRYEGEWDHHERHGYGIFHFAENAELHVKFEHDILQTKKCVFVDIQGRQYTGTFKEKTANNYEGLFESDNGNRFVITLSPNDGKITARHLANISNLQKQCRGSNPKGERGNHITSQYVFKQVLNCLPLKKTAEIGHHVR